jgi:hypothetical protein
MEVAKVPLVLLSLISYVVALIILVNLVYASDNTIAIQTKGSSTAISIDQSGTSNTTTVWCGLSGGTYATHSCSNATMTIDQHGTSNTARAYSQLTNHNDNVYTINQNGNSNNGYIDLDDDDNVASISQTGNSNTGIIYMRGDDNVYTITQTGNSFYAKMYAFGDDSAWAITQSGTGNHNGYIKSCSNCNNNDATITQSGSGAKDGDIEFRNNPSDNNTVNLTQSGDGLHVGNILVKQGSYTVNATQTGATNKNYTVTLDCTTSCNKTVTVNQFD